MSDDEREAARLLEPLRHFQPPTPGGVDVNRAVRTGKRTVLVRQVAGTVACLVAVLGVAVTLTLPSGQPPAGPSAGFGVATQEFGIGSAAGFTPLTYETGVDRQRVTLTAPELDGTDAVITMYAKGEVPRIDGEDWAPSGEAASKVDGRAALWLDEPVTADAALELAWRWKTGAWGFVALTGPDATRDRAHKVAQSVDPGADIRVPDPVRLPPDFPADAELSGTLRSIGERERPDRVFELRYTVGGNPDHRLTVGIRQPEPETGASVRVGDRFAVVEDHRVSFLDGTGLFIEISEGLELDRQLTELAAELEVDPDLAWPSTPTPSSEISSPTSASGTSSSPSGSTSEPTTSSTP